jgi:endonuclease YncB( thermonuclease family)
VIPDAAIAGLRQPLLLIVQFQVIGTHASPVANRPWPGRVVGITDGDTLTLLDASRQQQIQTSMLRA